MFLLKFGALGLMAIQLLLVWIDVLSKAVSNKKTFMDGVASAFVMTLMSSAYLYVIYAAYQFWFK